MRRRPLIIGALSCGVAAESGTATVHDLANQFICLFIYLSFGWFICFYLSMATTSLGYFGVLSHGPVSQCALPLHLCAHIKLC